MKPFTIKKTRNKSKQQIDQLNNVPKVALSFNVNTRKYINISKFEIKSPNTMKIEKDYKYYHNLYNNIRDELNEEMKMFIFGIDGNYENTTNKYKIYMKNNIKKSNDKHDLFIILKNDIIKTNTYRKNENNINEIDYNSSILWSNDNKAIDLLSYCRLIDLKRTKWWKYNRHNIPGYEIKGWWPNGKINGQYVLFETERLKFNPEIKSLGQYHYRHYIDKNNNLNIKYYNWLNEEVSEKFIKDKFIYDQNIKYGKKFI